MVAIQYTKGRLIKDGGEGFIYEVLENPNLLLKIYKDTDTQGSPIVTHELQQKLEYMKNNPPDSLVSNGLVAWPIELLKNEHNRLIGFVMPKLDIDEHLQRVYSYRHPKTDSTDYASFPSVKSRISIAINLCSALNELHRNGYVIGDFNHANIGVNYRTGQIYFMDCDSFHIVDENGKVYRTNVIMAGYLAPEIIKHCYDERADGKPYNLDKVSLPTFTKESDHFCLAIHIFKLLMNGIDPFRGVKSDSVGSTASPFVGNDAIERNAYVFRSGNKPSAVFCPPAESLPPYILELFNKAFIDGRAEPLLRPDETDWYKALNRYLTNDLAQCAKNVKHQCYRFLSECPYCAADDRHLAEQVNVAFITEPHSTNLVSEEKKKLPRKKQYPGLLAAILIAFAFFIPLSIALYSGIMDWQNDRLLQTSQIDVTIPVEDIIIENENETVTLEMGETYQIIASVYPIEADAEILYSCSNSDIQVSTDGIVSAPKYYDSYNEPVTYYVDVTAGDITKTVAVTVNNSYKMSWSESRYSLPNNWEGGMYRFENTLNNCSGLRVGVKIFPPNNGKIDAGALALGAAWPVYAYQTDIGWKYVGSVTINSQEEWYYVDLSFSAMNIQGIMITTPGNSQDYGTDVSYDNSFEVSDINYDGYVH